MPLELVEYRVWTNQLVYSGPLTLEIDVASQVPQKETWRVDRIAAKVTVSSTGEPPFLFVYDQTHPPPTIVPVDFTEMSAAQPPQGDPGEGVAPTSFYDADDLAAPITLLGGMQLALVFVLGGSTVAPAQVATRVQYARYLGVPGSPTPVAT